MSINIKLNGKSISLTHTEALSEVLLSLAIPTQGCALAVNGEIVPRAEWPTWRVNQGDDISLFQAIAGG